MSAPSYSTDRVSLVKSKLKDVIPTYFGPTLGRETDVVNIVAALMHYESRFNVDALGLTTSTARGSGGFTFLSSSAIQSVLNRTSTDPSEQAVIAEQKNNIYKGVRALGIMQIMGWNIIKGGSPSGKCEVERLRPDLAPQLVVDPGEDPFPIILGLPNLDKAILAGLVILEGKYKAAQANSGGFSFRADPFKRVFATKMVAAVGAYLGLGKSDLNNTTPEGYSQSIVGGKSYQIANGTKPFLIATSENKTVSNIGPSTNGLNRNKIGEPGCTPRRVAYARS